MCFEENLTGNSFDIPPTPRAIFLPTQSPPTAPRGPRPSCPQPAQTLSPASEGPRLPLLSGSVSAWASPSPQSHPPAPCPRPLRPRLPAAKMALPASLRPLSTWRPAVSEREGPVRAGHLQSNSGEGRLWAYGRARGSPGMLLAFFLYFALRGVLQPAFLLRKRRGGAGQRQQPWQGCRGFWLLGGLLYVALVFLRCQGSLY